MASKWFRKNQKKLMAIFVVVLMIAFTASAGLRSALDWLSRLGGGEVVGTAFDGENISTDTFRRLSLQRDLIGRMLGSRDMELTYEDRLRYVLLVREAERGGFAVSDEQAKGWLAPHTIDRARVKPDGTPAEDDPETNSDKRLDRLSNRLGRDVSDMLAATRGRLAIEIALRAHVNSVSVSDREARRFYKETKDEISVKAVTFSRYHFMAGVRKDVDSGKLKFDEARFKAQYEKYKDKLSAADGGEDFGYKIPAKVCVQYLRLNMARLLSLDIDQLEVSTDDEDRYWRKNRDKYAKRVQRPGTTRPSEMRTINPELSEVRTQVKADIRRLKAYKLARQLMTSARALASTRWGETSDGAVDPIRYSEIAHETEREINSEGRLFIMSGSLPTSRPATSTSRPVADALPLMSERELADIGRFESAEELSGGPGPLGRAIDLGTGLSFGSYAMLTDKLWRKTSKPQNVPSIAKEFPRGKESEILVVGADPGDKDAAEKVSDLYLFRVVRANVSRLPASLDEVRDAVKRDLIALEAFARARQRGEKFAERVRAVGIDEAVKATNAATRPAADPATGSATRPAADPELGELYVQPKYGLTRKAFLGSHSDYMSLRSPYMQSLLRNKQLLRQIAMMPRFRKLLLLREMSGQLAYISALYLPSPWGESGLPEFQPAFVIASGFPGIRDAEDDKVLDRLFAAVEAGGADDKRPLLVTRDFEGDTHVLVVSEHLPATEAEFAKTSDQFKRDLYRIRRHAAQVKYFDPEDIIKRCNWKARERSD